MTAFVLDCSAVLCWCFADEATDRSHRLLGAVEAKGAVVPSIWHYEVANVLVHAEKRGRLPAGAARSRLDWLSELPIQADRTDVFRLWGPVFDLSRTEGLTIYDASYLDLALRTGLPLASKDRELVAAARRAAAPLVPLLDP